MGRRHGVPAHRGRHRATAGSSSARGSSCSVRGGDFERLGQRTTTTFTKGKSLLDLRMGETMDDAVIEDVLRIVRRTRATRREVRPIRLHGQPDLPVVPKSPAPVGVERTRPSPSMDGEAHPVIEPAAPVASPVGLKPEIPAAVELSEIWCGLSTSLAGELETALGWMDGRQDRGRRRLHCST